MNVRQFIKNKTLGLFVKTNGYLSRELFSGMGFIICLHRVLPKHLHDRFWGDAGMAVSPEYLHWLITTIQKSGIEIIGIDEALSKIKTGKSKKQFAVITLDDGWKDNLTYGLPVFEKCNTPFTVYVSTCFADHTAQTWAEDLTEKIAVNTSIQFVSNNKLLSYSLINMTEKIVAYNEIRRFILEATSKDEFDEKLNAVFGDRLQIKTAPALNWDEVRHLSNHPLCTIGAHTINHLPLAKMSESAAFDEISASKYKTEQKIGKSVNHFAYPFGTKNECSVREFLLAKKAGYQMAVTGRQGNIFHGNAQHLMAIPRYPIGESTGPERLKYIMNGILHFSFNGFKKVVTD